MECRRPLTNSDTEKEGEIEDALSSAIFRLYEQLIPLSYLSSISGIINHFNDLHFASPSRNMQCTAKLRYYIWVKGRGQEESSSSSRGSKKMESECVGCINFPFISMSSPLEMLSQFQMPCQSKGRHCELPQNSGSWCCNFGSFFIHSPWSIISGSN